MQHREIITCYHQQENVTRQTAMALISHVQYELHHVPQYFTDTKNVQTPKLPFSQFSMFCLCLDFKTFIRTSH